MEYVRNLTDEDAKTIAESVFGVVENVELSKSKNGTKIMQFEANGMVCRYEVRDFGLFPISARQASKMGKASAAKLAEMHSAYMKFMKTARHENGALRFPNFEKDFNEKLGIGVVQ